MTATSSIKKLFTEYAAAFAALDFRKQAGFFADTFIMAGPHGVVSENKSEFLKKASKAADFYKRVGQTSAKLISLHETPISDQFSLVKTHWGVTFQKTGDRLIEFDVSYLVQTNGSEPKIILAIAHQDEQQAMKELGLLSQEPLE